MHAPIEIDEAAERALRQVAEAEGISVPEALARAIEVYRRQVFDEKVNASFAAARADAAGWAEEQAERDAWDATLADGFERA